MKNVIYALLAGVAVGILIAPIKAPSPAKSSLGN